MLHTSRTPTPTSMLATRLLPLLLLLLCVSPQEASTADKPEADKPENRICLNMIVKDESDTLPIMLPSIIDHLSGWVICDTGSTDNTIKMLQDYFGDRNMPGALRHHNWTDNFGRNRNM
eukprot:gene27966-8848_t